MLDVVVELVVDVVFDRLLDRDADRSGPQWACLFVGVVLLLLAIAVVVSSGLWYGLAVAVVGLALFLYGA